MSQDRVFLIDDAQGRTPQPPPGGEGIQLRDLVAGIGRRWWAVVLGLGLGVGGAGYLTTRDEVVYRSTATIWLPRPAGQGNSLGGLGSLMGLGASGVTLSELDLFRSRSFAGEVVDSAGLRLVGSDGSDVLVEDVRVEPSAPEGALELEFGDREVVARAGMDRERAPYGRAFRVRGVWMTVPHRPEARGAHFDVVSRAEAIGRFQKDVDVRQRDRSEMVDVGVTALSPDAAARATNTAVELFRVSRARNAAAEVDERARRLRDQIAFNDSALREAQTRVVNMRSSQDTYSSGALLQSREAERIAQEARITDLREERSTLVALQRGLSTAGGQDRAIDVLVASPGVAAKPLIGQLYGSLVEYQTRRDTMTAGRWGRSATHPDVRRLDDLIADSKRRLTSALGTELASLDTQIQQVEQRRAETTSAMRPLPAADVREGEVARQIDGLSKMSMMLREEYTRQQLTTVSDTIRVVDRALPGYKMSGSLVQMLVLGIFGGLMVGLGSASVLTVLDPTLRTLGDAERILEIPTLAVVPRGGRKGALAAFRPEGAEAYRTLRTNLRFSRVAPDARTLVVTSAEAGEGRSTVAANLAATVARQGVRVLLVDCDLSRATQHALFRGARSPGITDLLMGDVTLEAAVQPTAVDGVFLLAAGTAVGRSASEVLEGGAMQGMIAELSTRFHLLVLDTPPLLTDTAGTATLAATADGVIVVVRSGRTHRDRARLALRQLAAVRARVVGVVLNDAGSPPPARETGPDSGPRRAFITPVAAIAGGEARRIAADSETHA